MKKQKRVVSGLVGGVTAGLLATIPLVSLINLLCCASIWGGGIVGAWHFQREQGEIGRSDGLVIGAVTGIVAAIVTLLSALIMGEQIITTVTDLVQPIDPELASLYASFELTPAFYSLFFFTSVFPYTALGMLGGLLGVRFFGKPDKAV